MYQKRKRKLLFHFLEKERIKTTYYADKLQLVKAENHNPTYGPAKDLKTYNN